jgi:tetratricopeptide (TPR) repeat protein
MKIKKYLGIILAAILLVVALQPAVGQTPPDQQRLKTIETLIYTGRCEDAVTLLRDLANQYPRNVQVLVDFKNALICNKQLDTALTVLDQLLKLTPDPQLRYTYYLDIASVYLKKGDTKQAAQQIQVALDVSPTNPTAYEQAANAYTGNGYYPDAVKLLLDARKKLGDPLMFAKALGQLYEILRNYGDAAREYYGLLAHDTTNEVFVSGKMAELIKLDSDEGFDTGLKEALAEFVKQNPKNLNAQRYTGDLLMAQGKLEEAFARFLLVDSLGNGNGKDILYYATVARDNGDQPAVEKACNYLINRYPQSPFRIASRFILADSYFRDRRYADAVLVYDQITKQSKSDRDISDALYAMGYTKLYGSHDPSAALALFQRLIKDYPITISSVLARIAAADCYLALGKAAVADSLYHAVNLSQLQQKSQEELLFKLAEVQFYLGNFDAARDAYGKMMNTFPKSVFVNDCLRRMMLISEYPALDQATLLIYAEANYAELRFDYDSAMVLLHKLQDLEGGGSLNEVSWYEAGEVDLERGKSAEALSEYDSLITLYPESFYTPLAVERKGDVYSEINRDCTLAKNTYESLLLKYPSSLNQESVRRKLQHVERFLCAQAEKPKS